MIDHALKVRIINLQKVIEVPRSRFKVLDNSLIVVEMLVKNRNCVFGKRTFCIKMSLFFHDWEIEHFSDPDSITSNAAFSLVYKCNKNKHSLSQSIFHVKLTCIFTGKYR